MELALHLSGGSSSRFEWSVDTVFNHLWHTPPLSLKDEAQPNTTLLASPQQHCICGLVTQEAVRNKYSGWWKPVEFQLPNHLPVFSSKHGRIGSQKSGKHMSKVDICSDEEGWSEPESESQCTEDSLEGCGNASEDDVDSLEKTPHSLEEENDSLEGQLDSFHVEENDSLEDILERYTKTHSDGKECKIQEAKLEEHVSGALYDSFSAKFNATRLALEGFTQLFHIGQCIFDK